MRERPASELLSSERSHTQRSHSTNRIDLHLTWRVRASPFVCIMDHFCTVTPFVLVLALRNEATMLLLWCIRPCDRDTGFHKPINSPIVFVLWIMIGSFVIGDLPWHFHWQIVCHLFLSETWFVLCIICSPRQLWRLKAQFLIPYGRRSFLHGSI